MKAPDSPMINCANRNISLYCSFQIQKSTLLRAYWLPQPLPLFVLQLKYIFCLTIHAQTGFLFVSFNVYFNSEHKIPRHGDLQAIYG